MALTTQISTDFDHRTVDRKIQVDEIRTFDFVKVHRFRFEFDLHSEHLPTGMTGSAWRGTLGQVMLEPVPGKAPPNTHICSGRCAYCGLLKPQREVLRKGKLDRVDAPRPITIGARMKPNPLRKKSFYLDVTLLGRAVNYLPELIDAVAKAGNRGIGARQTLFNLTAVEFEQDLGANNWTSLSQFMHTPNGLNKATYEVPHVQHLIQFKLATPLRIVRGNKPRLDPLSFTFEDFFATASRRVTGLTELYGNHSISDDFKKMSHAAKSVPLQLRQLHRVENSRYSNRQREKLKMDGLLGEFYLDASHIEPHWPYLWFAQWLNIGKGSVMGLGNYETHT